MAPPVHIVTATAPTRICDCGGWTDTWFARYGAVFHIAVEPRVHVRVEAVATRGVLPAVTIEAANFDQRYTYLTGRRPCGSHPLIEAAIESVGVPEGLDITVALSSDMPPGASTGTSGAVCVAVVAAMRRLAGLPDDALGVARAAHAVETDRLGQQSGVQDQVAAACGGLNFVDIYEYPHTTVTPLSPSGPWLGQLDARLMLVYLGRSHSSTAVHEAVIRDAVGTGAAHPALDVLRQVAAAARDAAVSEDLHGLGAAMAANTEGQRRLHAALIGDDATRVIGAARAKGALGWKVNGAGGEGGSVALLAGEGGSARDTLEAAIRALSSAYRVIPIRVARAGLVIGEERR